MPDAPFTQEQLDMLARFTPEQLRVLLRLTEDLQSGTHTASLLWSLVKATGVVAGAVWAALGAWSLMHGHAAPPPNDHGGQH